MLRLGRQYALSAHVDFCTGNVMASILALGLRRHTSVGSQNKNASSSTSSRPTVPGTFPLLTRRQSRSTRNCQNHAHQQAAARDSGPVQPRPCSKRTRGAREGVIGCTQGSRSPHCGRYWRYCRHSSSRSSLIVPALTLEYRLWLDWMDTVA